MKLKGLSNAKLNTLLEKEYNSLIEAANHINVAISHSEIYSDLDYIKQKADNMSKILLNIED